MPRRADLLRDQAGAILVLALVFMVAGSLLVIPLAGLATTNLGDSPFLIQQRNLQTAGDGATDFAVESIRFSDHLGYPGSSGNQCTFSVPQVNGQTVSVSCTANSVPTPTPCTTNPCPQGPPSRDVSFTTTSGSQTLLNAEVDYWDFYCSATLDSPQPTQCTPSTFTIRQVGYATRIVSWTVTTANS